MSAKFIEPSHFTDPDAAARKEIANATEVVQDGRIYIERVNGSCPRRPHPRDQAGLAMAARVRHLCEVHVCRCRAVRLIAVSGLRRASMHARLPVDDHLRRDARFTP
jgi:hypothetical protein